MITTNIHNATDIRVQRISFGDFISHEVKVTCESGEVVTISAFAKKPLLIDFAPDRDAFEMQSIQPKEPEPASLNDPEVIAEMEADDERAALW